MTDDPSPFDVMMAQMAEDLVYRLLGNRLLGAFIGPDTLELFDFAAPYIDISEEILHAVEVHKGCPDGHLVVIEVRSGQIDIGYYDLTDVHHKVRDALLDHLG